MEVVYSQVASKRQCDCLLQVKRRLVTGRAERTLLLSLSVWVRSPLSVAYTFEIEHKINTSSFKAQSAPGQCAPHCDALGDLNHVETGSLVEVAVDVNHSGFWSCNNQVLRTFLSRYSKMTVPTFTGL